MTSYYKIQSIYKRNEKGEFLNEYSIPEFEFLKNVKWNFTEKIDGTNIRIIWQPQELEPIVIKGRTDKAQIPIFLLEKLKEIFTYDRMIKAFGTTAIDDLCLYGEGYGARINQGGQYIKDDVDFILFDIKIKNWWLERETVNEIGKTLGIKTVPSIFSGNLDKAIKFVKKGFNSQWGKFQAEGMVGVPNIELRTRRGDRVIIKFKHSDFI